MAFLLVISPAYALEDVEMIANVQNEYSTNEDQDEITFKTIKKITLTDDVTIPQRSIVTAEILQSQKERRWHKSGYLVCRLKNYLVELTNKPVDISDKELYFVVRKYEPINKKEASLVATELVLAQGASFFAPGVDILYFFTKGAIQRKKNPNWFKAGVSNAYDNSLCWFWLKGKPIELKKDDLIKVVGVEEIEAFELKTDIDIRKMKQAYKLEKKQDKRDLKAFKAYIKQANKNLETESIGNVSPKTNDSI